MMASAVAACQVVAGITLEHMPLDSAVYVLGMDRTTLESVMAPSSTWPHPAHLQGWKVSHDAIRYDMEGFMVAINKTKELLDAGQPLAQWQADAFQLIMRDFYHQVHGHHDHEEEIFFPWIGTRVQVPSKMSEDHKALVVLLDQARDLVDAIKPGDPVALKDCLSKLHCTFTELRSLMRQHLEYEEIVGLPLLRKNFTAKEFAVTEKKILATMKPSDLAWLLRPMPMAEKRATMRRLGIPGLVQRLVMLPAVAKDTATILQAYEELAAGERLPLPGKEGRGLFGC